MGFLLRRNTYVLSEWEQSLWASHSINKMVQLLANLISLHLEGRGCPQQAGPHRANGKRPQVLLTDLSSASHSLLPLGITNRHQRTFCFHFLKLPVDLIAFETIYLVIQSKGLRKTHKNAPSFRPPHTPCALLGSLETWHSFSSME